MDLPPRPGQSAEIINGKEVIRAKGGNAPQPVTLSQKDEAYALKVAETYAEYPRVLFHKAFKRERDAAGKVVPGGEVVPLSTADAISPNYPVPLNIAQRNGIQGIVSTSEGSPAIIGQHLYRTRLVPAGWQAGDKVDLAACKREEVELAKQGWVRTPGELNLPKAKTVEEESDE